MEYGDMGIWGNGGMGIWGYGDVGVLGYGGMGMWRWYTLESMVYHGIGSQHCRGAGGLGFGEDECSGSKS